MLWFSKSVKLDSVSNKPSKDLGSFFLQCIVAVDSFSEGLGELLMYHTCYSVTETGSEIWLRSGNRSRNHNFLLRPFISAFSLFVILLLVQILGNTLVSCPSILPQGV